MLGNIACCVLFNAGERVEDLPNIPHLESGTVRTDKGTEIEADLIFQTIGLSYNSSAYETALGRISFW